MVDTTKEIGNGLLEAFIKPDFLNWFDRKGADMLPGGNYEGITDNGLIITTKEGKKQTAEVDA